MIVLDDKQEVLERYWTDVQRVVTSEPVAWAIETEIPVYICRGKKFDSWAAFWPQLKRWR